MNTPQMAEQLDAAGQPHVAAALRQTADTHTLQQQLHDIGDPGRLVSTVAEALRHRQQQRDFAPLPKSCTGLVLEHGAEADRWRAIGLEALRRGEVAVMLLAGGQGTRLGLLAPKGCFDVGLPSGKTLYQLQADKIRGLRALCGDAPVHWYIMALAATRAATEAYFRAHGYFGLDPAHVTFFNQGVLPCFDALGQRMLMAGPAELQVLPDGNGGLYKAMLRAQILPDMRRRGIRHVHMYCVDNCLVRVADPVFIGFAVDRGYDLATKAVRKRDAQELVGLIGWDKATHAAGVFEYSEIPAELAAMPDPEAPELLYFRAANIVNHYYSVDLLERLLERWTALQEFLPFHIAKKKIAYWDTESQALVKPSEVNGIKLEQFIFDVFLLVPLDKFGCLEVDRAEEFSPLKNGPGAANDCPDTCRRDFLALGTAWVRSAGGIVPEGAHVEVQGTTSYAGENLEFIRGRQFADGEVL